MIYISVAITKTMNETVKINAISVSGSFVCEYNGITEIRLARERRLRFVNFFMVLFPLLVGTVRVLQRHFAHIVQKFFI